MSALGTDGGRGRRIRPRAVVGVVALFAVVVTVALAGAGVIRLWPGPGHQQLTVDFSRTVSLYPGSNVRILGVTVGTVDSVTPMGTKVRVKLSWDARYPVPEDVRAVIVSPAIIGDRFIQLTPAYEGGAKLADGSYLDQARTEVPVELDETYAALDQLATALGPDGANRDGALARLVTNGARNLDGQGARLNQSITALSELSSTFADNKDEFFEAITKLAGFVQMLDANDAAVREFNSSLSAVSQVLAGERDDLTAALSSLAGSLGEVERYVARNRSSLKGTVRGLAKVAETLARNKEHLAEVLVGGPDAITHLAAAYNPATGTLDTRGLLKSPTSDDFSLLTQPAVVGAYCGIAAEQNPDQADACYAVGRVLQQLAAAASPSAATAATGTSGTSGTTGRAGRPADAGGVEALLGVAP
ncbi:MCE family protein [Nocardioides sp. BYT-33-1]|uniref:MCE family protein n=1 Tax=Nocardioides sp. BYT-33-1 TaxID=3416952 RepID=UPI003F533DBC